ncbi:hypothetical protein T439DRAFT_290018 [Meredithblackwellia eburnea MCA 4105]
MTSLSSGEGRAGPSQIARPSSTSGSTLADLTACVRRTNGILPPPLVGCSLTLIGDNVYLFGGRLVPTRTMVSTLYTLSLRTLTWTLLWPPTVSEANGVPPPSTPAGPDPRYFHSAEAWGNKIVVFGGEGYSAVAEGESVDNVPLRTLGDICIWDTEKNEWDLRQPTCAEGVDPPAPRYAHLGPPQEKSLLIIMGGQDIRNTYLHSVNVLDLDSMTWIRVGKWERHIGTYRAVATTSNWTVVPSSNPKGSMAGSLSSPTKSVRSIAESTASSKAASSRPTTPSPLASSLLASEESTTENDLGLGKGEGLIQLSYSQRPSSANPEPILIFSNFNFTQVRRDLDLLSAPAPPNYPLDTFSLSNNMAGLQLPPGLRFPTGTIVGRHLLIFGTYLSHAVNNFSVWALDLGKAGPAGIPDLIKSGETLSWSRVDPGSVLSRGSWNRALGWKNSVVIIGDRERDIATDYDHRQTNFVHVAFIDLEAFGIYQPPPQPLPPLAQSFGLLTLSQPFLADFELICSDGKRLGCSRKLLEDRWPWFKNKLDDFKNRAKGILAAQKKNQTSQAEAEASAMATATASPVEGPPPTPSSRSSNSRSSTELRLTPRTLNLPEPSPVIQGFLQYLYTLTLCTPLQLSLPVLSALLVFAKTYEEPNLRALVVHALHEALSSGQWTAATVYEAATLGGSTALQIRALRIMMAGPRAGSKSKPSHSEGPTESGRHRLVT